MAIARFGRQVKRSYQSYGLYAKLSAVVILGLCFVFAWSVFSSFSVTSRRDTFDDIAERAPASSAPVGDSELHFNQKEQRMGREDDKPRFHSRLDEKENVFFNGSATLSSGKTLEKLGAESGGRIGGANSKNGVEVNENQDNESGGYEVDKAVKENDGGSGGDDDDETEGQNVDNENENGESDADLIVKVKEDFDQNAIDEDNRRPKIAKKENISSPLFEPRKRYAWKLCNTRSKHNYIPCIDIEHATKRSQSYRHHERSCPKSDLLCLVPLPRGGYETPLKWPESKFKILYQNVAHPRLAAYVKTQDWLVQFGAYLKFPHDDDSELKGGVQHYLESIEEMTPDIEWGKNIRIVLDVGCKDSSFVSTLFEKDVLILTLDLDDLVGLGQIALERGFPLLVSPFANRRLPFPSGVFDAIHCGECSISWHSNGGKLILEMNRILRPGGYFIFSTKGSSVEAEEVFSKVTASICWNILADKIDEISDVGVKIYRKPEHNEIYELRRRKYPPLCKENENPDAAWYVELKTCLHPIPEAIEQRGAEWPAEWPTRLHTFPDWMADVRDKLIADGEHWKAIVNNSYRIGIGIDWSTIRNVMDMKAIDGGFAAALLDRRVWVMNVVPVNEPDTLPLIFERGLVGVYHDWCEPFGSYPRSYDLLHADHLFSRFNNRCKRPVVVVIEMDRILRPGGWAIIRDKVETLNLLEEILRSLRWEIRMTFSQDREGILCARKTIWRP